MNKDLKKNLFIIGNGFDIAHGIPSKYSDFQKYIRSLYLNKELIDKSYDGFSQWRYSVPRANNILGHFEKNQLSDVLGFLDYCLSRSQNRDKPYNFYVNSDWWSIEEVLGNLDLKEFFSKDSDDPLEKNYNDKEWLMYDIAECFKYLDGLAAMWADQIDLSEARPIESFSKLINNDRLLQINNDVFLTFNYTPTLESIYGVKGVVHIHGKAGGSVMLGHEANIDVRSFCMRNSIPDYCNHAAQVLFDVTCKDTVKNVQRLSKIIASKCIGITDIYSYGFSFADIDLPYINYLCNVMDTKSTTWHLLDYDPICRRKQYINIIKQCGFKGEFDTYHIKTRIKKQKKDNSYNNYIKSKKRHIGKSRYHLEQIILRYQTVNYTPTKLDYLLFIPRVICCVWWILFDSIKGNN